MVMEKKQEEGIDYYEKVHLEHLHEHRRLTFQEKLKSTESFDKYLLSFATGSLYLSIYFTKDLQIVEHFTILAIGWAGLLVAILVTLISFLISEKAFEWEIAETDKEIEDSSYQRGAKNGWTTAISFLQWLSLLFFIGGLGSFVIFYFFNLLK